MAMPLSSGLFSKSIFWTALMPEVSSKELPILRHSIAWYSSGNRLLERELERQVNPAPEGLINVSVRHLTAGHAWLSEVSWKI